MFFLTIENSKGRIFEISGYNQESIRRYVFKTLQKHPHIDSIFVDTINNPFLVPNDAIYLKICTFQDLIKLLSCFEEDKEPDLIILEDIKTLKNCPDFRTAIFEITKESTKHEYNILFLNQFVYNFKKEYSKKKYMPLYNSIFKQYAFVRGICISENELYTKKKKPAIFFSPVLF